MTTICAPSTAPGGAIGIIRVSGSHAITIVNNIFNKDITDVPARKVVYGNIVSPSDIIDDVLLTVFHAPSSYTGEDSVEISCHGSSYIIRTILNLLVAQGCHMAQPGEFTQRAFLNGKMDLSQAEAVADLIASDSAASHRIAMQQMRGGISQKLNALTAQLLNMTSLLELELDFSEEDVEFADRSQLLDIAADIRDELQRLIRSFDTGNAIKHGIPVAIIGAPNVGKSTLLNQLLQDDKAIVSDIQGTTRDLIEDTITINDTLFRFIDTAGIRHTTDTIERLGIERSIKAAEKARVIILMNEPGVDFPDIALRPNQHVIRVTNKTPDFQALTGIGIDTLLNQLSAAVPTVNDADIIISNVRHQQALTDAHQSILSTIQLLSQGIPSDLAAEDLRQCIRHLEQITGRHLDADTVLQNIFKNFCIGK